MQTLPKLAVLWNANEHALRSFVRRNRAAQKLGQRIGPVIAYSAEEAKRLREIFENRGARPTAART